MSNRANARVSERTSVQWMTAFIDQPAETFETVAEFWLAVTGTTRSAPRGEHRQFATLVPPDGDAHLRVQRLEAGTSRLHVDLHVADPAALAEHATSLGASIEKALDDVILVRSPAGLPWCAVAHHGESQVTAPTVLPDGTRLGVQQVCIDIAPDDYEAECAFWAALTGWPLRPGLRPEYNGLEVPAALPLRVLLQRLDDPHHGRGADAHLDIFCSDPRTAADHHGLLGARVVEERPFWIVMHDPSGEPYCLIQREPLSAS